MQECKKLLSEKATFGFLRTAQNLVKTHCYNYNKFRRQEAEGIRKLTLKRVRLKQ